MPMTTPEQSQLPTDIDGVVTVAQETLLRDGDHPLTIIVQGTQRQASSKLPDVPETHKDKLEYMWALGQIAAQTGQFGKLQHIFLVSKAWLWEESETMHVVFQTTQDSQSKEILYASGVDFVEHLKHLVLLEIVRNPDGQIFSYGNLLDNPAFGLPLATPLEDAFVSGFHAASVTPPL